MTLFDARTIARGWLAVAVASGNDDHHPNLNRTVLIEAFSEGVRLIATDSYVLLRAWVANVEHDLDPEPDLDEAPYATAVAIDQHGRGKGFFGHVLRLAADAAKADAEEVLVRLNLGVVDEVDDAARPSFAGFESRYVVVEHPETERLKLRVYDGPFPDWRKLKFSPKRTTAVAVGADMLTRLGKVGRVLHETPVHLEWGGNLHAARVTAACSDVTVEGLVMPCRWDFERDRPWVEPEPEPEPEKVTSDA